MNQTAAPVEDERPRKGPGRRLAALLASVPFASSVVTALTVACILGTLLPQGADVAKYLAKHPNAAGRMDLMHFLGLTHVFSAWWFVGLLGLLGASLTVCTWRKLVMLRKHRGRGLGRSIGSALTHISFVLVLAGGVVRVTLGEKGTLQLREGERHDHFAMAGGTQPLPFTVHLTDFEVETYRPGDGGATGPMLASEKLHIVWAERKQQWNLAVEPGTDMTIRPDGAPLDSKDTMGVVVRQRVLDFVIDASTRDVKTRSDQPNNPAIEVELTQGEATKTTWLFARHPDFDMHSGGDGSALDQIKMRYEVQIKTPSRPQVKDYRSTLEIIENDAVVLTKTIEVNDPLSYGGYTFYQSGYDPRRPDWTSLQVVRDPGVPLVYSGFAFMIVGLAAVFYLYPQKRAGSGNQAEQA